MNFEKQENENERQYIWRTSKVVDNGELTWQEYADKVNKVWRSDESEYRNESAYRKPLQGAKAYYEDVFSKMISTEYSDELKFQIRELKKERYKLQTEKIENNRWLRENARDELIAEKIINAISDLQPFKIPEYVKPVSNSKSYLLCLADCHYGIEFEIKGLFGEMINSYSPEIFERRMWLLRNKLIEIIDKEKITELNIFELGDAIQGLLRLDSQLMQLRYGVLESAIKYAEFLSTWLNDLSSYVRIKFQMVKDSNHNQLRILGAPKNSFPDENMSVVIITYLKTRLENNPNIIIIDNPTGMNYAQLSTYSILGCHGEVKNLERSIDEFSRALRSPIDYLIMGHCHHEQLKTTGINSQVLTVNSMVGVDPYGMRIRKTSDAGASLFVFEQCYGKVREYSLKVDY